MSISLSSRSTLRPRRRFRLEGSTGFYQIAARSRHAPVRLEVVDTPVDSTLMLSSKNTRGPLEVYLHPTYQGRLSSEAFIGAHRWVSRGTLRTRLGMVGGGIWFGTCGVFHLVFGMLCLERFGGEIVLDLRTPISVVRIFRPLVRSR